MINWKIKTRGQRPIALDIGHNSIKMIQLAINDGHISVLAADKARIDSRINGDPDERRNFVVSKIKQMLAEGNFRGKKVISCLPSNRLKITSLRLARTESEKIGQALRKEAAQRFGLDPDTDAINYLLVGDVHQGDEIKSEFILFAADNESIKYHIKLLEEAGLRPVGIDMVPCALFRSFGRSLQRQEDKEHTAVCVDVGSRFTTVVFGRGREISFVKQIPIGGENFNQEVATKLGFGINEAEMLRDKLRMERTAYTKRSLWNSGQTSEGRHGHAGINNREAAFETLDASTRQVMVDVINAVSEQLAREISLCFRYYTVTFRGKRVERAVFSGGEAYERILLNVLKRQLAVEIEMAQPLKGFDMTSLNFDSDRRGFLCEWAVAVGLGLKGWNENPEREKEYLVTSEAQKVGA
ncbi:MAG: pilus assembly protein PilM [Phycisphaerae bacterium]|nr:pilus assembly protein PilM [Phycisphaerae bacterium]NIP52078.1 pilus assembly protein PilM [Phycisphaerae bacterium]NIS50043.1 pilus assembly protein PilM [Phycisphaerae bacterium]NIU10298.1 pilus assembly protein PilM [Phycisphaerae bacterium]NIU55309.1 pilus assembly protein PilM [Phycisphaerae bacterium]